MSPSAEADATQQTQPHYRHRRPTSRGRIIWPFIWGNAEIIGRRGVIAVEIHYEMYSERSPFQPVKSRKLSTRELSYAMYTSRACPMR